MVISIVAVLLWTVSTLFKGVALGAVSLIIILRCVLPAFFLSILHRKHGGISSVLSLTRFNGGVELVG